VKSSYIYPPPTYEVIYITWPSSYDCHRLPWQRLSFYRRIRN